MLLVNATSDFRLAGIALPGFPILLNADMSSCWEVNEFLRFYLRRGAIESEKSWEPIARSLYDYFGFLEAHELSWDDVSRGEEKNLLAAYRDYSFKVPKLARNTVRQRLTYICEFYKFAVRQNWISTLPFSYEMRNVSRSAGFLAHTDASGGKVEVNSVMPRRHGSLVKFLTAAQVRSLLNAVNNVHHRTIIQCGLLTGLRREELATFPVSYVFNPDRMTSSAANVMVTLDPTDGSGMRTKGSKKRNIYMGREVMKALHRYASHHRGARASLPAKEYPQLFLNQYGHPFAKDGKGIEAIIRKLGKKIDVPTHPHILRHTYATHMLSTLQRRRRESGIEPLVFVQKQLGHSSLRSTMIYLHLVNELADAAVLAYDEELNFWE